jgi:mono/diheme cytochrome c family protein
MAQPAAGAPVSTPQAQQPAPAPSTGSAAAPGEITPQMIALGDSIFHGQAAGGMCQTCHGPDAKGTQLAPDLTDKQWLNGDGSYQFIVNTVTKGVPTPKQAPAPMPPMGGAQLTPDQVNAVSAYVYSLSHPEAKKGK